MPWLVRFLGLPFCDAVRWLDGVAAAAKDFVLASSVLGACFYHWAEGGELRAGIMWEHVASGGELRSGR